MKTAKQQIENINGFLAHDVSSLKFYSDKLKADLRALGFNPINVSMSKVMAGEYKMTPEERENILTLYLLKQECAACVSRLRQLLED